MKKLLLILSFAFALQSPLAAMAQPKIHAKIEEPNKQKIGMIKRQYDNAIADLKRVRDSKLSKRERSIAAVKTLARITALTAVFAGLTYTYRYFGNKKNGNGQKENIKSEQQIKKRSKEEVNKIFEDVLRKAEPFIGVLYPGYLIYELKFTDNINWNMDQLKAIVKSLQKTSDFQKNNSKLSRLQVSINGVFVFSINQVEGSNSWKYRLGSFVQDDSIPEGLKTVEDKTVFTVLNSSNEE